MAIEHGTICPECGATVNNQEDGWGHRKTPPCSNYTFNVPPDLQKFLSQAPKDATAQQLTDSWLLQKFGIKLTR